MPSVATVVPPAQRGVGARLPQLTEESRLVAAARAAEDAGDYGGALRLLGHLSPTLERRIWCCQLRLAQRLAGDSLSWRLACWLVHPALRHAHEPAERQLLERYARALLAGLGVNGPQRMATAADAALRCLPATDLALFDHGLFDAYLAHASRSGPVCQAGPVGEWSSCPASVFRVEWCSQSRALVLDLLSDELRLCCVTPPAAAWEAGLLVYGRLVPVRGPAEEAFAVPPSRLDPLGARAVCRSINRGAPPEERLRIVGRAARRLR